METKLYPVHDIKADTYGQPLFFNNNVEALRSLEQAVKDPNTTLSKYPADYNLMEYGTYDSISGELSLLTKKITLANCASFIQ